ncbi:IS5 family transposase IS112 [Streptomyces sp. enrichment culture]
MLAVGRPLPGNRNDCTAFAESGIEEASGRATVLADGGYQGTGALIPHRRRAGQERLPRWKEQHNASHRQVRARIEHVFARMKNWKILRDCRLRGDGVYWATSGVARMHNLTLTG